MNRRALLSALTLVPFAAVLPAPAFAFGESDVAAAQSAIMSAGSRAARVRRLRDVPSVGVVNLGFGTVPRFSGSLPDPAEFRIAAEKNRTGVQRLRAALAANPVTHDAMQRHHVNINRVVGVMIASNGSLRFFVI